MKRIITITVTAIILLLTGANAQTLNGFFEKYDKDSRFESVSVGKFLFNLALLSDDLKSEDREMLANLREIKILTSKEVPEASFAANVMRDLDRVIEKGDFESLVEVREKGERVNIYTRMDGNYVTDLLISVREAGEMNLVWLNGKFSPEMIEKISHNGNNDSVVNLPINIK